VIPPATFFDPIEMFVRRHSTTTEPILFGSDNGQLSEFSSHLGPASFPCLENRELTTKILFGFTASFAFPIGRGAQFGPGNADPVLTVRCSLEIHQADP
jgi:hypothetical protein